MIDIEAVIVKTRALIEGFESALEDLWRTPPTHRYSLRAIMIRNCEDTIDDLHDDLRRLEVEKAALPAEVPVPVEAN